MLMSVRISWGLKTLFEENFLKIPTYPQHGDNYPQINPHWVQDIINKVSLAQPGTITHLSTVPTTTTTI